MADPTVILNIEPDWDESPTVAYSFLTAFQDTPYYVEQRRALLPQAVRSVNYKFVEKDHYSQKVLNSLLAVQGELLCTPIFPEPILVSSIVTGGVVIAATTDLTYLFNLRNCAYAVIIDMVTNATEMVRIASVSGQNIIVVSPISGTWVASRTIVYPAMAAVLKSIKQSAILNHVGSVEAEFEEITLGGEAASEWVGFGYDPEGGTIDYPQRVCCEDLGGAPPATYGPYFDNLHWAPLNGNATWVTDHWVVGGTNGLIELQAIGTWMVGYRPYQMQVTVLLDEPGRVVRYTVYDIEMDGAPAGLLAYSTGESLFRIYGYSAAGDIYRFIVQNLDDATNFSITNIEFVEI